VKAHYASTDISVKAYVRFFLIMREKIQIRALVESDWPAVRAIYLEGIATGHATFETDAPAWSIQSLKIYALQQADRKTAAPAGRQ